MTRMYNQIFFVLFSFHSQKHVFVPIRLLRYCREVTSDNSKIKSDSCPTQKSYMLIFVERMTHSYKRNKTGTSTNIQYFKVFRLPVTILNKYNSMKLFPICTDINDNIDKHNSSLFPFYTRFFFLQ